MKAVPVISPITWPPVREKPGVIGWLFYHLTFRRKARTVYNSIHQQLAARPSPPVPWAHDSIETHAAAILTETLNRGQFFGSYSYHPDDALLLLSVHPVDDMTVTEAIVDLEVKLGVKIKPDLHTMTFGAVVRYVASLVREKEPAAEH